MGTRADYYIGRTKDMEWLGSTAWDGYPSGMPDALLKATTEEEFRDAVHKHIVVEGGTVPERGWPWPWKDSRLTDYSYCFDEGKVWTSCFGHEWFDPLLSEPEETSEYSKKMDIFPDMSAIQKVAFGSQRSGIMIIGASGVEN